MDSIVSDKFKIVLQALWAFFHKGLHVNDAYHDMMLYGFYTYPEVCIASVKFWYYEFNTTYRNYHRTYPLVITGHKIIDFLGTMVLQNPTWKSDYFTDAIKQSTFEVNQYLRILGYVYINSKWVGPYIR
ncbi:hypothetical protein M0802_014171 [Mischocyttarus mexicanus]|nr:hypothetical protein M0802_014312 [Mischocyttarus mexicanus]KAI4480480.1 hypothetical protein M0802_014171 [Mischocyttarus mexicanus]